MGATAAARAVVVARQGRARFWRRAAASVSLSVRTHIVGLILDIVTPLLAFSAFLVLRSAAHEQDVMGNAVRERTREAAAALDHELGALHARLLLLAGSHRLQIGDFAGFRAEAVEAAKQGTLSIVLSDLNGQQIVNTRAEASATLPMAADLQTIRRVVATGPTQISNLSRSPVTGELFTAIDVPVLQGGQLTYVLSLNIAPLLPHLLADLALPAEWIASIADRAGYTLARSREADRFVGQLGRPAVIKLFQTNHEGWFPLDTRDGIPAYNAFAHVKFSGWVVAVGIPVSDLYAPVRHSTLVLILTGAVTVALALLLAMVIGHRVAGAISSLAAYADVVGRGEQIGLPETRIRETDEVARA